MEENGLSEYNFGYLMEDMHPGSDLLYRATEAQKKKPNREHTWRQHGGFLHGRTGYYNGQNTMYLAVTMTNNRHTVWTLLHEVANLDKRFYTGYSWKHIEDLPRMIYLTGTPVQKNIVLH